MIGGWAYITIIHRIRNITVLGYFIVTIINEVRFITVLTPFIVLVCIRLSNILSIRFSSYKVRSKLKSETLQKSETSGTMKLSKRIRVFLPCIAPAAWPEVISWEMHRTLAKYWKQNLIDLLQLNLEMAHLSQFRIQTTKYDGFLVAHNALHHCPCSSIATAQCGLKTIIKINIMPANTCWKDCGANNTVGLSNAQIKIGSNDFMFPPSSPTNTGYTHGMAAYHSGIQTNFQTCTYAF